MPHRLFYITFALVIAVALAFTTYAGFRLSSKYDGWIENDINRALGTRLTYSQITGKYVAASTRPDSAGLVYTDVLVEIDPEAFQRLLNNTDLAVTWRPFVGPNPPTLNESEPLPWWHVDNSSLEQLGWDEVRKGYRGVVESEVETFVFLLVPERRWMRYRRYRKQAA